MFKLGLMMLVVVPGFFQYSPAENFNLDQYNQTSTNFLDTNQNTLNELNETGVGIKEAVDYVLTLLNGEIISVKKEFKNGIPNWAIELITIDKGSLDIEISASEFFVIKITSDEGPFDYEIVPAKDHIPYSVAKRTAEESSGLKILKWNYYKNNSGWEYDFWVFTKSGRAEFRVDAVTGELIRKKKR